MSSRILAQVVRIVEIIPLEKSHSFDLACVLGYTCCVSKNLYHVDDLCLYIAPESLLPLNDDTRHLVDDKGVIRIKARKICNVLSEGYIAPLSWVSRYNVDPASLIEDQVVTEILQITQWISLEEKEDKKIAQTVAEKGVLGTLIPKTDETQVKQAPHLLRQFHNRKVVITLKMDGCSATYAWYQNRHLIFSRNLDITSQTDDSSVSHYHKIANIHNLPSKLEKYQREIAIQGELCAPSINKGRTLTSELSLFVFNIYNISAQRYLFWDEVNTIAQEQNLSLVPVLYQGIGLPADCQTKADLLQYADTLTYSSGARAEGIVIKTDDDNGPRISLKVISETYMYEIESENKAEKREKKGKKKVQES